ncbi:MAG: serine hydrolase domain-containing protein [Dehalococcoidia bacterium]
MRRHQVPGLAVGLLLGRRETVWGVGAARAGSSNPVTPRTLFQIGSVTKTFTATALMALRDRGLVDLDAPVRSYVPTLSLSNEAAQERTTIRHLLTHTAGWQGDVLDLPRGTLSIAGFVDHLEDVPQLTPPGAQWSYNNAGFVLAGRVVETVTGSSFPDAIRELLLDPLGLSDTAFAHDRPARGNVADIHVTQPGGPVRAEPWVLDRASWPAGGLVSCAHDLMTYLRFHLEKGSGTGLLSEGTLEEMQVEHAPAGSLADAVGLGWLIDRLGGASVVFHTGDTVGHQSLVLFVPGRGLALVILTNSNGGAGLCIEVADRVLAATLGLGRRRSDPLTLPAARLREYEGRYRTPLWDFVVRSERGRLSIETVRNSYLHRISPSPAQPAPAPAAFVAPDRLEVVGNSGAGVRGVFVRDDRGEIVWFLFEGRLGRKVAG